MRGASLPTASLSCRYPPGISLGISRWYPPRHLPLYLLFEPSAEEPPRRSGSPSPVYRNHISNLVARAHSYLLVSPFAISCWHPRSVPWATRRVRLRPPFIDLHQLRSCRASSGSSTLFFRTHISMPEPISPENLSYRLPSLPTFLRRHAACSAQLSPSPAPALRRRRRIPVDAPSAPSHFRPTSAPHRQCPAASLVPVDALLSPSCRRFPHLRGSALSICYRLRCCRRLHRLRLRSRLKQPPSPLPAARVAVRVAAVRVAAAARRRRHSCRAPPFSGTALFSAMASFILPLRCRRRW